MRLSRLHGGTPCRASSRGAIPARWSAGQEDLRRRQSATVIRAIVSERLLGGGPGSWSDEDEDVQNVARRRGRSATTSDRERGGDAQTRAPASPQAGPLEEQMFDSKHVPRWSLQLLAWAPVGVLLAAFRAACWCLGVLLDLPVFRNPAIIKAYCNLVGFHAKWRNLHLLPKGHHVMVSNHTTSADLMVLFQLPQRYVHLITTAMPEKVTATKHLPVVLRPATPDVYTALAKENEQLGAQAPPVHVFPEGGLTNGRAMLQFSRGFMKFVGDKTPVVPVALRARTPFGVRTHTLTSSFLANLFFLSFVPWVEVEAVVLPPVTPQEGESRGAFVQRVQDAIAKELRVPVSEMTIQQKRQLMKRRQEAAGAKGRRGRAA